MDPKQLPDQQPLSWHPAPTRRYLPAPLLTGTPLLTGRHYLPTSARTSETSARASHTNVRAIETNARTNETNERANGVQVQIVMQHMVVISVSAQ